MRVRLLAFTLLLPAFAATAQEADWSAMLERISSGVVSLDVDVPRAFDTDRNQSSQATGFVVDIEQGLILTNRHVISPGPVRAKALFINREEVELQPVYRDPVHDFGLFRFDPAALRFLQPAELRLAPERAAVGLEVRIVGNDAGEQLSILSGTIARLDRQAPQYGYGRYNDFNTFYIQAASGSSGGSSGSPVLDRRGDVVALNAGASNSAASSFFLPLPRIKRALDLIRAGEPVSRGTLQTRFVQMAYDELGRLGLQATTEGEYRQRFPGQIGMLVVSNVMPEGVADNILQVGDILLAVNRQPLVDFVTLEAALDDAVGGSVLVELERLGQKVSQQVAVADLHALTPAEYIEFGKAVVHELSYQQAWHLNRAQRGIYVAAPGYVLGTAGLPAYSVIEAVDGRSVTTLDEFAAVLGELADGQKATLRYYTLDEPATVQQSVMRMDRRWYPAKRCALERGSGEWPCRALPSGPAPQPQQPVNASFAPQPDRALQRISESLVLVNFDMPYSYSGVSEPHYYGTGLVVDAEQGLVVVDRNTVPEALGDVRLTFAASAEISGRVEFIHPLHNLAVLSYDPAELGSTRVRAAQLKPVELTPGDELRAVGLRPQGTLANQAVKVAAVAPLYYPLSNSLRFRETNLEGISLVTTPGIDGVLMDKRARVVALWSSFAYDYGNDMREDSRGVPVDVILETLQRVRSGQPVYSLEIEMATLPMAQARNFGLPEAWTQRLLEHDPQRREVLTVVRTVAGSPADEWLRSGDLLLAVNAQPVNRFREVERAVHGRAAIDVTVWRDGTELTLSVPVMQLAGSGINRLLNWGGAVLQEPYRDVAAQRGIAPEGVYVSYYAYGSPAARANLSAGSRIVEVDGQPVANLNDFVASVADKGSGDSVRLTLREWNNAIRVITLKPDPEFWPAWEIVRNGDWHRVAPQQAAP